MSSNDFLPDDSMFPSISLDEFGWTLDSWDPNNLDPALRGRTLPQNDIPSAEEFNLDVDQESERNDLRPNAAFEASPPVDHLDLQNASRDYHDYSLPFVHHGAPTQHDESPSDHLDFARPQPYQLKYPSTPQPSSWNPNSPFGNSPPESISSPQLLNPLAPIFIPMNHQDPRRNNRSDLPSLNIPRTQLPMSGVAFMPNTTFNPAQNVDMLTPLSVPSDYLRRLRQQESSPTPVHHHPSHATFPNMHNDDNIGLQQSAPTTNMNGWPRPGEPPAHHIGEWTKQGPFAPTNPIQPTKLPIPPAPPSRTRAASSARSRTSTTSARQHACPVCSKTWRSRGDLTRHMHTHDPDANKYICSICSQSSRYPKDLKRHMKTHSPKERHLLCNIIGCEYHVKGFQREDHVKRHMLHMHKQPWVRQSRV